MHGGCAGYLRFGQTHPIHQPVSLVPFYLQIVTICNMHWGCLSHKLKGARARWQLVYDWVVNGLRPPARWLWIPPGDISIFAKYSCGRWERCTGPAGPTQPPSFFYSTVFHLEFNSAIKFKVQCPSSLWFKMWSFCKHFVYFRTWPPRIFFFAEY